MYNPPVASRRGPSLLIYRVTNQVDGCAYIGHTGQKAKSRWKTHRAFAKRGSQFPLHRAIRHHGVENFIFEVLYECSSREEMIAVERGLIAMHGTTVPRGYNLIAGRGSRGRRWSAETRMALVANAKRMHALGLLGNRKPGEYRHSAETREKLRAAAARLGPERRRERARQAARKKITAEQAAEIRRTLKRGGRRGFMAAIARRFNISPAQVTAIGNGSRWSEV